MERDLKVLRSKRAEREHAAGLERLQESSREPAKRKDLSSPSPAAEGQDIANGENAPIPKSTLSNDVIMIDDFPGTSEVALGHDISATLLEHHTIKLSDGNPSKSEEGVANMVEEAKLKDVQQSTESAPMPVVEDSTRDHIILQEINMDAPASDAPLETPTTANLRDANFESMFNDTELAGPHDAIDFDLDFSNDANINHDLLNGNPFGEMTSHSNDFSNLNTTSNEDINTLLPGLESYVTASDDFSMLNMPPTASDFNVNATKAKHNLTVSNGNATVESIMGSAPIESSFDDLFFGSGDLAMGGTDDNDMGGDDNIGDFADFDDDWFKSDGT